MNLNSREDQAFVSQITSIVGDHLGDEKFGVSELAKKAGLSRSYLHRRLQEIKGQSVSRFIREIRLKKGRELLEKENLTVSEIAYDVGFSSPSYFIKCFHEKYGYAPGEYVKHVGEEPEKREAAAVHKFFQSKFRLFLLGVLLIIAIVTGLYFVFLAP